jgi:outer membrane protein assembly factor BamD
MSNTLSKVIFLFLLLGTSSCSLFGKEIFGKESSPEDAEAKTADENNSEEKGSEAHLLKAKGKDLVKLPESEMIEKAKHVYDRELFSLSLDNFTLLRDNYPASPYSAFAELKAADSYYFSADYPQAISAYEEFVRLHPGHEAVPYAKFLVALSQYRQYKGINHDQSPLRTAIKLFADLGNEQGKINRYTLAAKKMSLRCAEELAAYEAHVARFYDRRGDFTAAEERRKNAQKKFPKTVAAKASAEREAERDTYLPDPPELLKAVWEKKEE